MHRPAPHVHVPVPVPVPAPGTPRALTSTRPRSGTRTWVVALALGLVLLSPSATVRAQQRYALRGGLNPTAHTVQGHVSISFVNTSERPLPALLFHLYMNAFRDRNSVFMRESEGQLRGDDFHGTGSIDVKSLRVDGADLLPRAQRELVPGDRTQLRVPLPAPLAVGARTQIECDFVTHLPPVFARAGYDGQFHAVTQWFPKLAKLEPSGTFAGFPYHGNGEFYADFADYTLIIDTPEDYVVGATGELADEQTIQGRTVRRFEARSVHDAAWVASPLLRERDERMGTVKVRVLYPPGYELALPEHLETVRRGLAHYGARYVPYPYRYLTVVIPPRDADGAAGMEYPTLFLTAGEWFSTRELPRFSGAFVTAHELAHEWFYGLLASDEVEHPVLDEGLAEWASLDLMREMFGPRGPFGIDGFEFERRGALSTVAPPGLAANAYRGHEYGASIYGRAAIALESIRRAHGRARFEEALRRYAVEQRFAHPTPDDLARNFDAVYGPGFARHTLLPLLLDGADSSVQLIDARSERQGAGYRTHVFARRTGAVALPTWVAAYDAQGKELARAAWPSHVAALDVTLDTNAAVARVVADPDRALLVDRSVRDDIIVLEPAPPPSLLTRLLGLAMLLLSWVGP